MYLQNNKFINIMIFNIHININIRFSFKVHLKVYI